jgi:hypothetical protein
MRMTRRRVIVLLGGGVVVAAAAPVAWLASRSVGSAVQPWSLAGGYSDPRKNALSWALLAPNPHNRQPWVAELVGDRGVHIYRDRAKNLPETDPFDRQLTIGMGCFLELMVMAAAQGGHAVELTLFPEGESGPVAHAVLTPGGVPDPLFAHVLTRRTCKEPFEDRPLSVAHAKALEGYADEIIVDDARVSALRDLTQRAWDIEQTTPRTWKESIDLCRVGAGEINANPDGIDLGGPMFNVLGPLGLITRQDMLNPDGTGFKQTMAKYHQLLAATRAYSVITTPGNTPAEQIQAGQRWLRLNLMATGLGVSVHPASQALQEYAEMNGPHQELHKMLRPDGGKVQMLARLGYGPIVPESPRWPLEAFLKGA